MILQNRLSKYKKAYRLVKKNCGEYDGFYLLEQKAASIFGKGSSSAFKKYAGKALFPLLRELFSEYGTDLTPDAVMRFIRLESGKRHFSDGELCLLSDFLTLLCIEQVALAVHTDPASGEPALAGAVRFLRALSESDFDKFFRSVSENEKILCHYDPLCYTAADKGTKAAIREEVRRLARRHRLPEAEAALLYCRSNPKVLRPPLPGKYFFLLWGGVLLLLLTGLFLLLRLTGLRAPLFLSLSLLFALLPLSEGAKQIAEWILGSIARPIPIPKLKPGAVPKDAKTLVVITTLLSGGERDDRLFARLPLFLRQSREDSDPNSDTHSRTRGKAPENVRFAILADLPDSDRYESDADRELLKQAKERVEALNRRFAQEQAEEGAEDAIFRPFCLFVRRRSRSRGENKYTGWERKRGALLELCRFLRGKKTSFSLLPEGEEEAFFREDGGVRYVITLDADTDLYIGAVQDLVYTMLHPANKPVVKNGRVVNGHGILQPRMTPSLAAASASPFAVMISGCGGTELYQSACFDLYGTLFGHGNYCGKGIFDVDCYLAVLDGAFPENAVLSHDLPEGARLRAGALSEITLTDECPKNPLSYFKRQHRWLRGDFQSLIFLPGRMKNEKGEKVDNPTDPLSKFMILDNLRRALCPLFTLLCLFLSLFLQRRAAGTLVIAGLFPIFFPVFRSLCSFPSKIFRRFYSNVLEGSWHALCRSFYSCVTLFEESVLTLDAFSRSLYRMTVSRKKLLEWVTAAGGDTGRPTFLRFFRKQFFSFLTGLLLALLAPYPLQKLLGLAMLSCPFVSYLLSQEYSREREMSEGKKALLRRYCADAWGFYERFVGPEDHFLPPDNYQELPVETVAHRTSPTNIAMYLLSILAAADFGFLSPGEMAKRLERTLETLERLPRHRGHFYNWYDTKTLDVLGNPYISSVDSGNLAASLAALRQGMLEYAEKEQSLLSLAERFRRLEREMDFRLLYHPERELFCIGYDVLRGKQSEGYYDLLMSEARITSYYAVARGIVPKRHWQKLGRPLIGRNGHIGVASWSGTAFEYFMPPLLLPVPGGSLGYEAMGFALFEQIRDESHHLWGRSESGYFAFDADMNYQYRAFGASRLALERLRGKNEVLAPYASFLALCISFSLPLQNLRHMEAMGLYGTHGFFEAVDFTPDRVGEGHAVIRSYMAHHTGMLIAACDNAVFGGRMRSRFLGDTDMEAALELLDERIPVDAPVRACEQREQPPAVKYARKGVQLAPQQLTASLTADSDGEGKNPAFRPAVSMLSGGDLRILADTDGNLALFTRNEALTYPCFEGPAVSLRTLRLLMRIDGKVFDLLREKKTLHFTSGSSLRFETVLPGDGTEDALSLLAEFTPAGERNFLAVHVMAKGNFDTVTPLLLFEPVLCPEAAYRAHPAFRALSVTCEFLREDGILLFRRRRREPEKKEKDLFLAVTVRGGQIELLTERDRAFPLLYGEKEIRALFDLPFDGKADTPIFPLCALRQSSKVTGGKYETEFLLGYGNDEEALLREMRTLRRKRRCRGEFDAAMRLLPRPSFLGMSPETLFKYESLLLSCILHDDGRRGEPLQGVGRSLCAPRSLLWKYGVSGDLPILSFGAGRLSGSVRTLLQGILCAHRSLLLGGFRFDLLLLYSEEESYFTPKKHALLDLLRECGGEGSLARRGGVHFLPLTEENEHLMEGYACFYARLREDEIFETLRYEAMCRGENGQSRQSRFSEHPAVRRRERPATDETLPLPKLLLSTSSLFPEGFTKTGDYFLRKGKETLPRSFVYASPVFGTLVTENSLGFSWFGNSSLFRLSAWDCDPVADLQGERLLMRLRDGKVLDLAALAADVVFGVSSALWQGEWDETVYSVRAGVDPRYPLKTVLLTLENRGRSPFRCELYYDLRPDLGGKGFESFEDGAVRFFRGIESGAGGYGAFLLSGGLPAEGELTLNPGETKEVLFLLGAMHFSFDKAYYAMERRYRSPADCLAALRAYGDLRRKEEAVFRLSCADPGISLLFNRYLPYETRIVRIFGRSGFFQSGGAYGFRDQLQDCLCMVERDPSLLREQLLRCAAHQYLTGDVQHWWHPTLHEGKGTGALSEPGIKSRCSDDLLFLPFALAEYVRVTGDGEICRLKVSYLDSPPLREEERERYERPARTARRESLYAHGMRAIERTVSLTGEHGLALMGSGDWNDGLSHMGDGGRGESLFVSQFLLLTVRAFLPLAREYGTGEDVRLLTDSERRLRELLPSFFREDRYLRGFTPEGEPYGVPGTLPEIDLLPQAFAAILGDAPEKAAAAMNTALRLLYDRDNGIWRLLTPPFDGESRFPGYIRGYAPGCRENGGQYTHGALFGVWGLYCLGRKEEAFRILNGMLPCKRALDPVYRGEPYAAAADVCTAEGQIGRAGWTQYTGSAGWMLRILLRHTLGYLEEGGRGFRLSPGLCAEFPAFLLEVRKMNTFYRIEAARTDGETVCLLDGERTDAARLFPFDGGRHTVRLSVGKTVGMDKTEKAENPSFGDLQKGGK